MPLRKPVSFTAVLAATLAALTLFSTGYLVGQNSSSPGYKLAALEHTPEAVSTPLPVRGPFVIERDGYTVCFDGRTRNPIWVYECLRQDHLNGVGKRRENFQEDPVLPEHARSTLEDYRGSGYDRGHLAAAGNHQDSQMNVDETFYLSNISPQVGIGFNRGRWRQLEQHVRELALVTEQVHVISGPLYLAEDTEGGRWVSYPVIGPNDVAVPTHFFKVVFMEHFDGRREQHTYLMANRSDVDEFSVCEMPLTQVQRLSGLAFDLAVDTSP